MHNVVMYRSRVQRIPDETGYDPDEVERTGAGLARAP